MVPPLTSPYVKIKLVCIFEVQNQLYDRLFLVVSESPLQLSIQCLVLREFGLSSNKWQMRTQILSLLTSLISIILAFSKVW